jgi:PST family polysaccharide transporter
MMFYLAVVKIVLLLGGMALLPTPAWACASVGLGFGAHAIGMVACAGWCEKVSPRRFVPGFIGPLMACGVMAAAALGAHHGLALAGVSSAPALLFVDMAIGALVYVPAAFVVAPQTARECLALLRSLGKR